MDQESLAISFLSLGMIGIIVGMLLFHHQREVVKGKQFEDDPFIFITLMRTIGLIVTGVGGIAFGVYYLILSFQQL